MGLNDLKKNPDIVKKVNATMVDALIAELSEKGYDITKAELAEYAKEQNAATGASGGFLVVF